MTLFGSRRSQHVAFAFAAGFALALLAAPAAQAFTIDDQSNTNSDGSAKYVDPDARLQGFSNNGQGVIRQGNTTFQFGPQRTLTDQRYNNDRMFDPNGRPGDDR